MGPRAIGKKNKICAEAQILFFFQIYYMGTPWAHQWNWGPHGWPHGWPHGGPQGPVPHGPGPHGPGPQGPGPHGGPHGRGGKKWMQRRGKEKLGTNYMEK